MDAGQPLPWHLGAAAFVNGMRFIVTSPRSWPYAAVPAVIMAVLSVVFTMGGVLAAEALSAWLFGQERGTWGGIGYWLVVVQLSILSFVMGVLLALVVAQPLSGFALEAIVRLRETALTGRASKGPSLLRSLFLGARVALVTALVAGCLFVSVVVVNVVLPPAVVLTVPLNFLATAWLLAWNFLDYPLGLRSLGLRARLRWAHDHLGAFTTFGACWSLILVIPGIVLLLLPMGVAGATDLVVRTDPPAGR